MSPLAGAISIGIAASLLGISWKWWGEGLIAQGRSALELPPPSRMIVLFRCWLFPLLWGVLTSFLVYGELGLRIIDTPEVQPPDYARWLRATYHALLVGWLLASALIDLDCTLIPDQITFPATALGIVLAVLFNDLQIVHLWVDWGYAIPDVCGPYIPPWYVEYPRCHALAWSVTGAAVGMGVTAFVRALSHYVLRREAIGSGDITLMMMMGSYLGWQIVLVVFVLSPLIALAGALVHSCFLPRASYIPYGPYLGLTAYGVLFFWGSLWKQWRMLFSDLVGLSVVLASALFALFLLLFVTRVYMLLRIRRVE
ncbi:MAG: hypothetical protein KatS3mg113_0316 [Planctomycetaceae bacterium]|nr:MAG: hypothetical protein KatS3mg113_0316 [Planctomycetaceae bacterium]